MITNCHTCGHYRIHLGSEIEGARTLIKKLRLDLKNPTTREAVKGQVKDITRLEFEIALLLYGVVHGDVPYVYEVLGIAPPRVGEAA